jgi:hypothetical protein
LARFVASVEMRLHLARRWLARLALFSLPRTSSKNGEQGYARNIAVPMPKVFCEV